MSDSSMGTTMETTKGTMGAEYMDGSMGNSRDTMETEIMVDISAYADIMIFMKKVTQIFKALGDETRLRIMALLVEGRELCVCDIMASLDLPQSTVSRHLSYLRNAGLVDDRRQGIWMYYRLTTAEITHAGPIFDLLAAILSGQDQAAGDRRRLKEHLAAKEKGSCGGVQIVKAEA